MVRPGADYSLGLAFGRVVKAQPLRHPSRLNAVLADLLAGDLPLRAPLRELVELPAFLEAEPLVASATAVALVSFLLDELGCVYRDETLARLRTVLCGYFALPEAAEAEPAEAPYVEEKREQEELPNNYKQVDGRLDDVDRHKEILKRLLNRQLWNEADRETWQLLVASCGGGRGQESFESIWRAAPCALLYDINRLWCEASHFRFGFSVQRALWEELVSLSSSANATSRAGSPREPARIFAEFLQSRSSQSLGSVHSGAIDSAALPPGFYPRGGMHRVWEFGRWQIAWDSACLLSHFAEVHGRLVDCGLVGIKLDAGTRQQLQALHQAASPPSAAPAEVNGAAAREPSQTKEPSAQSPNAPATNSASLKSNDFSGFGVLLLSWLFLGMFLGSFAGPTVTRDCSSTGHHSRTFCYLWHVPSGLSR
jgi:hypothetical protein